MLSRNNNVRISKSGNGYSFNYSQYCSADIRQSQLSTPTYLFSILSLISLFRYITTMFYQSYTNITSTVYVGNKQTGRRVQLKTDPRYLCCYIQFCTYICLQILSYMYIIKSQCHIVIAKQFVHMSLNFYLWPRLIQAVSAVQSFILCFSQ